MPVTLVNKGRIGAILRKDVYRIHFFDHFFFGHILSWKEARSVLTLRIYKLFLQVFYSVCTL